MSSLFSAVLAAAIQPGDVIAFTFFTGYMAMLAATVFFLFERGRVAPKWKLSLLVSALITGIAGVHYFYMRDVWLETGTSPTEFRYIDWTLTVPLMCVEFYLLLRPYGAKIGLMWRLILAAVVMLVTGYIGEAIDQQNNILWGVASTLGWAYIVYEIVAGPVAKMAKAASDPSVGQAVSLLRKFVLIGWAIYPIGYMLLPGNLLSGLGVDPSNMDLLYNIGDAVNKIGFGLVIYSMASKTIDEGKTVTA
jgi:sensory rhodopsin